MSSSATPSASSAASLIGSALAASAHASAAVTSARAAAAGPASSLKQDYKACLGIVKQFAPILKFHKEEVYWCTDVDSFLPHMIIQKRVERFGVTEDDPPTVVSEDFFTGSLTRATLVEQTTALTGQKKNSINEAHLRTRTPLDSPSETQAWFNGTKPTTGSGISSYVVITESADQLHVQITYWWLFNYNQGKTVAGTSWGNHLADWTHVRVRLGRAHDGTYTLQQVMFDAHGDKTFIVAGSSRGEFQGANQVIVYVAKGSHECYPKAGAYPTAMGTRDYCDDSGPTYDTSDAKFELYTYNTDSNVFETHSDPLFPSAKWIDYRGRWGNWADDVIGQQLVSAPEGLYRPGEYAMTIVFEKGYTGSTLQGSPTVVWFNSQFICYFKDPSGRTIFYITSRDGSTWGSRQATGHVCSDPPCAVVFNNEVHLLFRDGGGNGMMHVSSSTGLFTASDKEQYTNLNIDWKPSAAVKDPFTLVVVARDHGGNGIKWATLTKNVKNEWGWKSGYTGWNSDSTATVVSFQNILLCYFKDHKENGSSGILRIRSDDGTRWQNEVGGSWYTGFNTSSGPTAVVLNDQVWIFFRDGSGNGILRIFAQDYAGVYFKAPSDGWYIGLNCDDQPAVTHAHAGIPLVMGRDAGGSGIMFALGPSL